jgi:hypothetical protein
MANKYEYKYFFNQLKNSLIFYIHSFSRILEIFHYKIASFWLKIFNEIYDLKYFSRLWNDKIFALKQIVSNKRMIENNTKMKSLYFW